MGEQLTESDVKKIKEEIEYRKIVVRKKELEAVKEAMHQMDSRMTRRTSLQESTMLLYQLRVMVI